MVLLVPLEPLVLLEVVLEVAVDMVAMALHPQFSNRPS